MKKKKHDRFSPRCFMAMILFLGILCSLCSCATNNKEITIEPTTFTFDQGTYPTQKGLFEDYLIAAGDVLDVLFQIQTMTKRDEFPLQIDYTISIKFVNSPDLNETQVVQPDGKISLPYLGEVSVLKKTVSELTAELEQKYSKLLKDPQIYVTVPDSRVHIRALKEDLSTTARGLSRLVTVRPDGYATFPLLGDIFVAKSTLPQIVETINKKYNDFLPGLHVDLFLEEHSGSTIYVLGQVASSGTFQINKPTNILQAAAMAGGFTDNANIKNIMVFRKHENKLVGTRVNLKTLVSNKAESQYFNLKPDDIVYVNKTKVMKSAEVMQQVADFILFRGWSVGP
jgi:polysaccharide export outer membrane protein